MKKKNPKGQLYLMENNMLPEPIVGKHYVLTHKLTGSNLFRGYVLIVQKGWISDSLIFRLSVNKNTWYHWTDYNYEYIGDIA